jgi:hypothetical protein
MEQQQYRLVGKFTHLDLKANLEDCLNRLFESCNPDEKLHLAIQIEHLNAKPYVPEVI